MANLTFEHNFQVSALIQSIVNSQCHKNVLVNLSRWLAD